jgi:hypothetical protein
MSDDELQRAVGRIEGKLDDLVGLTTRVSSLERWRAFLAGAWLVTSYVIGILWLK